MLLDPAKSDQGASMADIIEFGKKVQDLKSVRDADQRTRKIEAIRKLIQCQRCMMKCAKCGTQLEGESQDPAKYISPHRFCSNCQEEYEEYRDRVDKRLTVPRYYWHNDLWMEAWKSWLDHQRLLDEYRLSKEFLQLLREVEEFTQ
jgi:hypothetical protein